MLNWERLEQIRLALGRVNHESKTRLQAAQRSREKLEAKLCDLSGLDAFSERALLVAVNELRRRLSMSELSELKESVDEIAGTASRFDSDAKLSVLMDSTQSAIEAAHLSLETLAKMTKGVVSRRDLDNDIRLSELARLGTELIPPNGQCPLCETAWPPGELAARIAARLQRSQGIAGVAALVRRLIETDIPRLEALLLSITASSGRRDISGFNELLVAIRRAKDEGIVDNIEGVLSTLKVKGEWVRESMRSFERKGYDIAQVLHEIALRFIDLLELRRKELAVKKGFNRAAFLRDAFESAKSGVVKSLYEAIADRFAQLYSLLHSSHLDDFSATLTNDGASLRLAVAFESLGLHPPVAYHSEGHQDSMGIAMFIALREYLSGTERSSIIILDDVVMSIDARHRRSISSLLKSLFESQLIITSHDLTWAEYLCQDGVIERKTNRFDILQWTLKNGPEIRADFDLWKRFDERIAANDPAGAAQALRRGLENFFSLVCERTGTKVRFSPDGRFTLGDLMPPGCSQLRKLLRTAIEAAKSWGNVTSELEIRESEILAAQKDADVDQWELNSMVHFDPWHSLACQELVPLASALKALQQSVSCKRCGGGAILAVFSGLKAVGLKCGCGSFSYTLEKRKKE